MQHPLFTALKDFLKDRFRLDQDNADQKEVIESIHKSVEFKGSNLWILLFAIFTASIGLNVNSTAVIIGAMLISPLMSPIIGVGLGVAINDIELIKKALKNFTIAVVMGTIASATYFFISPLGQAQSELLARTSPTIWDVFIALFGGGAGVVAATRKEKFSNVIPGVAIATALMPPLCTAGYGIAKFAPVYFFGAFYLFTINSVFISIAAFLIFRFLKYPSATYVDPAYEKRVRAYMFSIVFITVIPSIYLAYDIVKRSVFQNNASSYIERELNFDNTRAVYNKIIYTPRNKSIELFLIGEKLDDEMLSMLKKKLTLYSLDGTELIIKQGYDQSKDEIKELKTGIVEDLYRKNQELMEAKERKLVLLEEELNYFRQNQLPSTEIALELQAVYPEVKEFSISRTFVFNYLSEKTDTLFIAFLKMDKQPEKPDRDKIEQWLKLRTKALKLKLVIED